MSKILAKVCNFEEKIMQAERNGGRGGGGGGQH